MVAEAWFDEDLYSLYFLIEQNQMSRRAYALTLVDNIKAIRNGPEQHHEADGEAVVRTLHVSLAAEVHKAFDSFVALCRAGEMKPDQQFGCIFEIDNKTINKWLGEMIEQSDAQRARKLLPHASGTEFGLMGEEARAIDGIVDRNGAFLIEVLKYIQTQREFLQPFRNKWSHTAAFQFFGHTDPRAKFTPVPVLKIPTSKGRGKELGIVDNALLASDRNEAALLRMLADIMAQERLIVEARMLALRNKGAPYLPRWATQRPKPLPLTDFELLAAALQRADAKLPKLKFDTYTSVSDETVAGALEFYERGLHGAPAP